MKTEPGSSQSLFGDPSELLTPPSTTVSSDGREPSPFGLPSMLVEQEVSQSDAQLPPVTSFSAPVDCSHDAAQQGVPTSMLQHAEAQEVEAGLFGDESWGTGDDEIEFVDDVPKAETRDANSVDIDLTLDDDATNKCERRPVNLVETCPICERVLAGMDAAVRSPHVHSVHSPMFDTERSRPCGLLSQRTPRDKGISQRYTFFVCEQEAPRAFVSTTYSSAILARLQRVRQARARGGECVLPAHDFS